MQLLSIYPVPDIHIEIEQIISDQWSEKMTLEEISDLEDLLSRTFINTSDHPVEHSLQFELLETVNDSIEKYANSMDPLKNLINWSNELHIDPESYVKFEDIQDISSISTQCLAAWELELILSQLETNINDYNRSHIENQNNMKDLLASIDNIYSTSLVDADIYPVLNEINKYVGG